MNIKTILLSGIILLLLSCVQQTEKSESDSTEPVIDTVRTNLTVDTTEITQKENSSPYQQELNHALSN